MSEIQRGTHLPPGEGESVWLVGDLIEVKLASEDTGGAYSMVEVTSPRNRAKKLYLAAVNPRALTGCVATSWPPFLRP